MTKSETGPLSIAGKKCNLPSFLKLSSNEHAKKLDYVLQTTCAYNTGKPVRPFVGLLIVPVAGDIDKLYDMVVDNASLKEANYNEASEIAASLYKDIHVPEPQYTPIENFVDVDQVIANEASFEAVLGKSTGGEFTVNINGVDVKCKLTGVAVMKNGRTKESKVFLSGLIACAQTSVYDSAKKGGRVAVTTNSDMAALSLDTKDTSVKLSAILSIHNVLHNAGGQTRNGVVNNALLCYSNSIWLRAFKDNKCEVNEAFAFRDTNPFVDLVMHFTPYSPFVLAHTAPVCYADYVEVSEYDVYQKLNELTKVAIDKNTLATPNLKKAIKIRENLRQAWAGSEGDVSNLISTISTFFNEAASTNDDAKAPLGAADMNAALMNLLDASNCCQNLYVFGEDDGVEKDSCITAEDICAFIGKK